MSDIRNASREFMTEFINTYRAHPALWKTKSKDYVNRNLKNTGYEALIEIFKKVDQNADRDLVAKKIQSLRGSFRKELKKYLKYQKNGGRVDEQYVPSLWYFDMLMFTRDQEPADSLDSIGGTPPQEERHNEDDYFKTSRRQLSQSSRDEDDDSLEEINVDLQDSGSPPVNDDTETTHNSNNVFKVPPTKKFKKHPEKEPLMQSCTDALVRNKYDQTESEAFGRLVAAKHSNLSTEQRMYAELLIIAVLNKGFLQKLSDQTTVVD
ncbi:hypothetical protein GE061_004850 [Apolygus lucorum]|uniref:Uncharacterized protein n=1 Tax=Apolygus lucorum TaxID=248454 RepID=A0A6A4IWR7_APOLU|nr:hypothetical protein GE061_004850 [Apolygus lucorum]